MMMFSVADFDEDMFTIRLRAENVRGFSTFSVMKKRSDWLRLVDRITWEGNPVEALIPYAMFSISVTKKCHGYGKALMAKLVEEARSRGVKRLIGTVDITKANPFDLTAWYQRRGFVVVARSKVFYDSKCGTGFPVIFLDL